MMRLKLAFSRILDHGLNEFLSAFVYLYICFGSLLLYKATILREHGIDYVPLGLALGKALLLAKFMLIGHKLHVGENVPGTLMRVIAFKSGLFLLVLLGLTALEEAIVSLLHHRTIADAFQLSDGKLGEAIAASLLLLLILIPYFAYKELDRVLGEGRMLELLRRRA